MKQYLKQVISIAVLGAASTVALAAPPPSTVTPPTSGSISTAGSAGSLILAVWDPITQRSLVENLGLTLGQVGIADMTVPGEHISFGSVDLSALNSSVSGNWKASDNVQWAVFAGNSLSDSTKYTTDGLTLAATGSGFSTITSNLTGALQVKGAINAINAYGLNAFNNASQCNSASNPCTTLADADARYFGAANYGSQLAGLPSTASVSGVLGTAQSFFSLTTTQTSAFAGNRAIAQYTGGSWLLSSTGALTYDVAGATVPLPAALWLLLSGLGGMGVMSRSRRSAAEAA